MSTHSRTVRRLAFTVAALMAGALLAEPAVLRAANGLLNPDFDSGISGWDARDGALAWNSGLDVDACTNSGVAVGSTPVFTTGSWTVTVTNSGSCLPVAPSAMVWMVVRILFSTPVASTDFGLLAYTDANCSAGEVEMPMVGYGPLPLIWMNLKMGGNVEFVTRSVRLLIRTKDPTVSNYSWSLDRLYLGTVDPVFFDDFGAAATCRWLSSSP
jgi:hypothetical protein